MRQTNSHLLLIAAACFLITLFLWKRSESFVGRDMKDWEDTQGLYVGNLPASRNGSCSDVYTNSLGAICGSSEWVVKKMTHS